MNGLLAGAVPQPIAQLLVSGNLVPLLKKDGNVRPVVVGEVLRRLVSKICVAKAYETAAEYLQPLQVGVGVSGGVEALLHSFNRIIRADSAMVDNRCMALIDFTNAFNEVNRSTMLTMVREKLPSLFPWVYFCYSIAAPLFVQSETIHATTGVQQGDPLGPLLFALVLQPHLVHIKDNFNVKLGAYLDDVTVIGSQESILQILQYFRTAGPPEGLHVSSKTLVWFPAGRSSSTTFLDGWSVANSNGVQLLGGSVSTDQSFTNSVAMSCVVKWQHSLHLMMQIRDPQLQLLLLRACLGSSKVVHLLRSSPPCLIGSAIKHMEDCLRNTLRSIIVGDGPWFGDFQFGLATLPIDMSGLGVYNPADLGNFTFVASMISTQELQDSIIGSILPLPPEFHLSLENFQTSVSPLSNIELPLQTQKTLAKMFYDKKRSGLVSSPFITSRPIPLQRRFRAILESTRQAHASDFLLALPNEGLGQIMSDMEFRAVLALRLLIPKFSGSRLCSRKNCSVHMDSFGYHAICCIGKQMFERHELVANALHMLAFDANLQPQRNAPVQCLGVSWRQSLKASSVGGAAVTNYRPADILLNWDRPRTCVYTTVVSPILASMPVTFVLGAAALAAQEAKYEKHQDVCAASGHPFIAFAADTFGGLAPDSRSMLKRIASLIQITKMYPEYLANQLVFRRISFAIHLGVARQLVARRECDLFFEYLVLVLKVLVL